MAIEWKDIKKEFAKPFLPEQIEWRIQNVSAEKQSGLALAYIDSRAVQNRLDEVVGVENWRNEFTTWHTLSKDNTNSQICGISIFLDDRKEWLTKWDGAENTDIEPIKGGISDAFKRAAVQWGIGRYLYDMQALWVDVEQKGRSWVIAKKEYPKLNAAYNDFLKAHTEVSPESKKQDSTVEPPKKPNPPLKQSTKSKAETLGYKVLAVSQKQFKSGVGSVLELEQENGEKLAAYLQAVDKKIKNGVVLCDVKFNKVATKDESSFFTVMSEYKIVA